MCGIVGYIGEEETAPLLMRGLKRLEYRGYDSAGLAINMDGNLRILRRQGNLAQLEEALTVTDLGGHLGIGHTRWATHGRPSEENAHPHTDCDGRIAVVHNGIIENYHELRNELQSRGHTFRSETDTETLAHLIEEEYDDSLVSAVRRALAHVKGSYAIAVISRDEPDVMVAARQDSPLILGIAESGFFVASDIPALIDQTRRIVILENGELVELGRDSYRITNHSNAPIKRDAIEVSWDIAAAEKSGFEDFMLKEIYEQPDAIRETLRGQIDTDGTVTFDDLMLDPQTLASIDKVFIVACGTSLHAGMVARLAIERWAGIPTEIDSSSEFRYREPILTERTLVVAITQSGETADTLAGVRIARESGAKIIAVTNVVGSTVTREVDGVVYTHAGPEIGVAATKTLVSQIVALILLAIFLAQKRGAMTGERSAALAAALNELPEKLEEILVGSGALKVWAKKYHDVYDFLFLGRGIGYPVAMEGALKLKEISYIHAEGYPAGEMKHGPIALVKEGVPIVAVAIKGAVYDKILSNMQEAKARGGTIIAVATAGNDKIVNLVDEVYFIPETEEILSSILAVVPLQLLAYYIAKERGCNVDQPRNLAKSVTVE